MKTQPIRLTGTSYAVLGLLEYRGPSTPYDLKGALESSIENFWPVPHTTFYAEPARLAAAGYLSEDQESGGRRRKVYALTAAGREALREWLAVPTAEAPQLRDEMILKIFCGADPDPILAERIEWHRRKLAELEGYLEAVRGSGAPQGGVERSLTFGTAFHRLMIEMQDRYRREAGDGVGAPSRPARARRAPRA
jgi:PadR family transcriptional regulator, regulatory protein AphA